MAAQAATLWSTTMKRKLLEVFLFVVMTIYLVDMFITELAR